MRISIAGLGQLQSHASLHRPLVERLPRTVAQRTSRRSFLAHLSRGLLGAAIIPLLPVSRVVGDAGAFDFGDNKPASDPESC